MSAAHEPEDDAAHDRLQYAEDVREEHRARRMAEAMGLDVDNEVPLKDAS